MPFPCQQKGENYIRFASTALGAASDHVGKVGAGIGVGWGSGQVRFNPLMECDLV